MCLLIQNSERIMEMLRSKTDSRAVVQVLRVVTPDKRFFRDFFRPEAIVFLGAIFALAAYLASHATIVVR